MQKYEQIKTLGQGGYGKAILARRKSDKQQFVIKEVRLTSLGPKDREDAIKEAKVLASLKHPYIVEYTESFQERGCLYIVMGYADGGDLSKKIEARGNKLFTEEEVLHDFIEIALAIKYIHNRKICHRDLKGQNIFLMKDGTVKLGDFGIARVLEHTFQVCRTRIGTPFYLSPEICQGRNYDMKTDIWSLGCILYELCTLKHAFQAGNMNQLLMNIIRGNYTPISSQYSQDLRNLLDRMLTKEPERRPNINQILAVPFIQKRLSQYLDKELLEYEMKHTILHGRKPFAAPTIILKKEPPPPKPKPKPLPQNQPKRSYSRDYSSDSDDYDDEKARQYQKQKMMMLEQMYKEKQRKIQEHEAELARRAAALKQQEAQIAARERAMKQQANNRNYDRNYYDDGNDQSRAFLDQRRQALANKERMRHNEMSGCAARDALCSQFSSDSDDDDYYKKKGNQRNNNNNNKGRQQYDLDEQRRAFFENQAQVRANRERMRQEEMNGGAMKALLQQAQNSDSDYYSDEYEKKKPMSKKELQQQKEKEKLEAIKVYMREQRHQRLVNQNKAQMAENPKLAQQQQKKLPPKYEYSSDYYDYYSDTPPPPKKQQPAKPKSKQEIEQEEIAARNAYMREQRHQRIENQKRIEAALRAEKDEKYKPSQPPPQQQKPQQKKPQDYSDYSDYDDDPPPQPKKEVKELNLKERNDFARQQRHLRREYAARAAQQGAINMDQIIAEEEAKQRANPKLLENKPPSPQANNQQNNQDSDSDEPPPPPKPKRELTQEERNAYMREERHQRRKNAAKLKQLGPIDMDALIAEAEAEQRANPEKRTDAPKPSQQQQQKAPPPQEQPKQKSKPKPSQQQMQVDVPQIENLPPVDAKKSGRLLNHPASSRGSEGDATSAIKSGRLLNPRPGNTRANDDGEVTPRSGRLLDPQKTGIGLSKVSSSAEAKPSVAEAKRQRQNQQQNQQNHNNSPISNGGFLDKAKMRELFQKQREGIRKNHDKIKAAQEGSRDPNLMPASSVSATSTSKKIHQSKPRPTFSVANANGTPSLKEHKSSPKSHSSSHNKSNDSNKDIQLPPINIQQGNSHSSKSNESSEKRAKSPKRSSNAFSSTSPRHHHSPRNSPRNNASGTSPPVKEEDENVTSLKNSSRPSNQTSPRESLKSVINSNNEKLNSTRGSSNKNEKKSSRSPRESKNEREPKEPSNRRHRKHSPSISGNSTSPLSPHSKDLSTTSSNRRSSPSKSLSSTTHSPRHSSPSHRDSRNHDNKSDNKTDTKSDTHGKHSSRKISPSKSNTINLENNGGNSARSRRLLSKEITNNVAKTGKIENNVEFNDNDVENGGPKLDLSMALNSKSANEFLKSRSIVLENLNINLGDENDEIQNENQEQYEEENEEEKELDIIRERANILNDALDINEDEVEEKEDEATENEHSFGFYLQNKVLNLPIVSDSDSLSYRAEAIRAFLEREIGLDNVIALKRAVLDNASDIVDNILRDLEPGIVVLAQHLLILDESIENMPI